MSAALPYHQDLRFVAADMSPRCRAVIDQRFELGWHLNYYLGGSLCFRRDDEAEVVFTRPTLFWIGPDHHYRFGPARSGAHWRHHWVTMTGERARRCYHQGLDRLDPRGWLEIADHAPLTAVVCELIQLVRQGEAERHGRGQVLLERILSLACEACERRAAEDPLTLAVREVATAVREEPARSWDFRREARVCGCSYHHFRRRYRTVAGRAPQADLQWSRLAAAARRLQDPAPTVAAVAEEFGYPDPARFSRLFKRQHGLSPRAFRAALPA